MTAGSLINRRKYLSGAAALAFLFSWQDNHAQADAVELIGINLSAADFDTASLPGKHGTDYLYPPESYFEHYGDMGITLVRLPFRWERIQHSLDSDLDAQEVQLILSTLDNAHKHGVKVLLDMHNYYRYHGKLIASPEVPIEQFARTWTRIASEVSGHPALYGYGLMNEPHDTNGKWPQAALAAARAIRSVDREHWILVAGDSWSSAERWPKVNLQLIDDAFMRDPDNKLIYEGHVYFDSNASGTYKDKNEEFDPMIGVRRVEPFVKWLKDNGLRGFIGEYGVPYWSESAMTAMDNLVGYLNENCMPSTYWAGGPWWGDYPLALDVDGGKHRPQLKILKAHLAHDECTEIGPS